MYWKSVAVGLAVAGVVVTFSRAQGPVAPEPRETLNRYCTGCHNDQARVAGLSLKTAGLPNSIPGDAASLDIATWEKVLRKLRMRAMPPAGSPRPDEATYNRVTSWLETRLDQAAAARPNPGLPLLHRLNRTEYANAIEDLLGLKVDVATLLPPDDSAFGFDNNAEVLGLSPVLIERYLTAADRISALALGDPEIEPGSDTYRARQDLSQDQHIEGLPFGTVGGMLVEHTFPLDAEYEFRLSLFRNNLEIMRGIERTHQLELSIDDERIYLRDVGGADDLSKMRNMTDGSDEIDARFRIRVPVKAGRHKVVATFVQKRGVGTGRLQNFVRSSVDTFEATGRPHLETITILGPFGDYRKSAKPVKDLAALEVLARRAYRRPVTDADLKPLREFYQRGAEKRGPDGGLQMALRRMLASPSFVFRAETSPDSARPGALLPIQPVELASRLSFFLWSSIPDDTLVNSAVNGSLAKPVTQDATVRRMLTDPKGQRLVTNFAGQWLQLRNLKNARPNSAIFPDFDDNLRQDFRQETEMLFASILAENRSVLDLLRADYTFLNERLAKHYGVPGIYGSNFRRVPVTQEERKGILGHGSVLTVTSHADRTSPVVRGKWILENLLGAPPPPPPPDVPTLPENADGEIPKTLRARLELHRASPVCASCHKVMDPIGFSLDNFDAVGAWRTQEFGTPINASGKLADGTEVNGVVSLRNSILARPEVFVSTVTEKLMIYGLGRGLEPADMPAVRKIVRESRGGNYKIQSIIMGVVRSVPFQMRRKPE
ncbi:MAG: DUF1592 domain-containing protein [Acidobacteriota bacterium]